MKNYMETVIEEAAKLLISKKLTIAFAESATAGRASAEFSLACNAGKFLKGGMVCYDANLKSDILNVPEELIERYTPESMEVTRAIAKGLMKLIEADIHIGITGLPCPGGSESAEKPVGTMFIYAFFQNRQLFAERKVFNGTHKEIVTNTVDYIASMLLKHL
jgi:nicotinamide-nucleotide amidase